MSTTTVVQEPHGHGPGHEMDPHHQHHFTTMEQQFDTSKIGMWLFIVTEILLFGGLFAGFGLMQQRYPKEFIEAHEHLQRGYGTVNTMVLLISSFTMVMGVLSARTNQPKKTVRYLVLTILCAAIFMCIKYVEYTHKFEEGLFFFAFYFMMTGLHGIHVLVGMVLLGWLAVRANRGEFSSKYYTPVDLVGLYWHVVDMIWIYLFPLYYLIK
jgi:cytochrome c oxidase subunit 3